MGSTWNCCGCLSSSSTPDPDPDTPADPDTSRSPAKTGVGPGPGSGPGPGFQFQGYFQIFFWFAMLIGLLSPVALYYTTFPYFPVWSVIQRFFVLYTVNCSWLTLVSPIGYFLLQAKILSKAICAVYSICLCLVIVAAMVSIAFTQSQDVTKFNLGDEFSDNSVLTGIKDHFSEKGDIPIWLQELQSQQKCCGFSGPEDWKLRIYPQDKPAIEDVPESCCIKKVVGCNLVVQYFHNKTDLGRWIWTDGCQKTIETRIHGVLHDISFGCLIIMILGIILVSIYWCQLLTFSKQAQGQAQAQAQGQCVKIKSKAQFQNDERDYDDAQFVSSEIKGRNSSQPRPSQPEPEPEPEPGFNFESGANSTGLPSESTSSAFILPLQGFGSQQRRISGQSGESGPPIETLRSVQFDFNTMNKSRIRRISDTETELQFPSQAPVPVYVPVPVRVTNSNRFRSNSRRRGQNSKVTQNNVLNANANQNAIFDADEEGTEPELEPDPEPADEFDLDPDPGDRINNANFNPNPNQVTLAPCACRCRSQSIGLNNQNQTRSRKSTIRTRTQSPKPGLSRRSSKGLRVDSRSRASSRGSSNNNNNNSNDNNC